MGSRFELKQPALDVRHLTRLFSPTTGVDDVTFALTPGEIVGLLGRNGAGKSTLIQLLIGALKPDLGTILYGGLDLRRERNKILGKVNFYTSAATLPQDLTVWECLVYYSYLYGLHNAKERVTALLSDFSLGRLSHSRISVLSSGEAAKVGLAKALVNTPLVLYLDEPTANLDLGAVRDMRSLIKRYSSQHQCAVLLASHVVSDLQELCNRLLIIKEGILVRTGSPKELSGDIRWIHIVHGFKMSEALKAQWGKRLLALRERGSDLFILVLAKDYFEISSALRELTRPEHVIPLAATLSDYALNCL